MTFLTIFAHIPSGEGFGFNGNIFETNLINLSVVIAVVVSFGGDALRSLLDNRKQIILNNLQEADQKAKEAEEKLTKARAQLDLAKKKAIEIREQGTLTAEQEKKQSIRQTQEDLSRLEEIKQETIRFQQQKAISQVSQQVVSLALSQVREKLSSRLDPTFHSSVNNFNIVLFTNYKPN
jgi:F-type H+-transporting ATPase subunit b